MKIFNHVNIFGKLGIMSLAILVMVGSQNGSGFKVKNSNLNLSADLSLMAIRVENNIKNDIYNAKETYTGDLTGYGADCPLCGGKLACLSTLDVTHGNVEYEDQTYGNIRIVASSLNLPCGSVIKFDAPAISSDRIVAIVLDRGVSGTAIDLLLPSNNMAGSAVGRQRITYDVVRRGW